MGGQNLYDFHDTVIYLVIMANYPVSETGHGHVNLLFLWTKCHDGREWQKLVKILAQCRTQNSKLPDDVLQTELSNTRTNRNRKTEKTKIVDNGA